jgi:PPOX class probable F420-dependent enzyme
VRNLGQNPLVNLHLNSDDGGGSIFVLQGTAEIVRDAPASHTVPEYAAKYGPKLAEYGWSWERFETDYPVPLKITPSRIQSFD